MFGCFCLVGLLLIKTKLEQKVLCTFVVDCFFLLLYVTAVTLSRIGGHLNQIDKTFIFDGNGHD